MRGRGCCDTDHKLSTHRQKVFVLDVILREGIRQVKIRIEVYTRKIQNLAIINSQQCKFAYLPPSHVKCQLLFGIGDLLLSLRYVFLNMPIQFFSRILMSKSTSLLLVTSRPNFKGCLTSKFQCLSIERWLSRFKNFLKFASF